MKRFLGLAIAVTLAACPAMARFVQVGETPSGEKLYFDTGSLQIDNEHCYLGFRYQIEDKSGVRVRQGSTHLSQCGSFYRANVREGKFKGTSWDVLIDGESKEIKIESTASQALMNKVCDELASEYIEGTCDVLHEIGIVNIQRNEANYTEDRDRDMDGVACEN
jgi:hypothetical protein